MSLDDPRPPQRRRPRPTPNPDREAREMDAAGVMDDMGGGPDGRLTVRSGHGRRADDPTLHTLERWFKFASAAAPFVGLLLLGLGFRWWGPNDRLSAVERRTTALEESQQEMKAFVRFLVATKCLEITPQTRRDLQVAGIQCDVVTSPGAGQQPTATVTVTSPVRSAGPAPIP